MGKYGFNIAWSDEDQGYIATCPDFPGLSAFGGSIEEALSQAQDALGLFIKTYQEDGLPLPEPQTVHEYSGQFRVRLSKEHHRQAAQAAAREGVSLNQFVANAVAAMLGAVGYNNQLVEQIKQMVREMEGRLLRQTAKNNQDLAVSLVRAWEQPSYNSPFSESVSNARDASKYVLRRETETVEFKHG